MAYETYRPLFHELFTKVNNAKDKPKKIKVLQAYRTEALEMFLKGAFDPNITWLIPEGDVPYIPNEAPDGTEHTILEREAHKLHNYVQLERNPPDGPIVGNPNINSMKREMMFIQLLEGLSAGEAKVLCLAKERTLSKEYKGLTAKMVQEAFGWDENFVAVQTQRVGFGPKQPVDLGRTQQDFQESQRRTGG